MKAILRVLAFPALAAACLLLWPTSQPASEEPLAPLVNGMVYVPAGEFIMGSTTKDMLRSADLDEFPQRRVYVDDFYIDIHEVTNIQYKVYLDSTGATPPHRWSKSGNYAKGKDGFPVTSITWHEAKAYAEWAEKRLPTEVEWEKAARGTDGRRYPWGDNFDNTVMNNGSELMPVMSFPEGVSPYGAYDMAGNVAEWVSDWYKPYPRTEADVMPASIETRTPGYGDREFRVYRGGSWNGFGRYARCANRERERPNKGWMYVGFRCAMDGPN